MKVARVDFLIVILNLSFLVIWQEWVFSSFLFTHIIFVHGAGGGSGGSGGDGSVGCFIFCGEVSVTNHGKKNKPGGDYVEKTNRTDRAYPQITDEKDLLDDEEDLYDNSKEISSLESSGDDWYKEENSSGFYNSNYTSDDKTSYFN